MKDQLKLQTSAEIARGTSGRPMSKLPGNAGPNFRVENFPMTTDEARRIISNQPLKPCAQELNKVGQEECNISGRVGYATIGAVPQERITRGLIVPIKNINDIEIPAEGPPEKVGDKIRKIAHSEEGIRGAVELAYRFREKIRGERWEEERVRRFLPELMKQVETIVTTTSSYADTRMHIRANVKEKANIFVRIGVGIWNIFKGNSKKGVEDAAGGASELLSEPDANTPINSAIDMQRLYLNTLKAFSEELVSPRENWRIVYGFNTRRPNLYKVRDDIDIFARHLYELTRLDYSLSSYFSGNGWLEQGGLSQRNGMHQRGDTSLGQLIPTQRLPRSPTYGEGFLNRYNFASMPLSQQWAMLNIAATSQRSRTNAGKEEVVIMAETLYSTLNLRRTELLNLGINNNWHSRIQWVDPITKYRDGKRR